MLSESQQRFILEYLKDGNARKAAVRAGYSPKTAKQQGSRLLTRVDISDAIQAGIDRHLAGLDLDVKRILEETGRVGISDLKDLFDEGGHLLAPHELPDDVRKAVASIKVLRTQVQTETDGDSTTTTRLDTVEVKFWDKLRALELLGKFKGLLRPKPVKGEAGDSWEQVLVRMTARQKADQSPADVRVEPDA